jgi:hypothetical protein
MLGHHRALCHRIDTLARIGPTTLSIVDEFHVEKNLVSD